MVKNAIKIYGRIKPVLKRKDGGHYYIQEGNKEDTLFLQVRDRDCHDDHKTELNQFRFYKVFDQHIRQHEIFTTVAKPIVDSALQGYNGTVFAYGQTGSGKTFTITGGPDDFEDRGLIPRAIEYVFRKISTAEGCLYTVCVTYLQIYNEAAYDLLGQHPRMARLEDLPRLNLLDDTEGYLHIRNLSLHPVGSEHEALNLLFLGDTNRAIAETPMNQASSRSHCMFTVHLAIRKTTWKSARRAKLHFVDLAGSERVHKKGEAMDGRRLNEARHINLSLHYLEQVITALAESKRTHVPYRNCVITTMLRDSIGGNCLTSMVATLSLDSSHLPETLATCRFAQRVALVKNEATLNEDRDPMQEVSVLKSEVKRLKEQIRMLTEDRHKFEGPLTQEEEEECRYMVNAFLEDSGNLELPLDLRKIEYCCHLLKRAVEDARKNKNSMEEGCRTKRSSLRVEKCMEELLQQRNDEIAILTELLRKEKRKRSKTASLVSSRSLSPPIQRPSFDDYHKIMRHAGLPLTKHDQVALRKYVSNPCHAAELNNLRSQLKNRHHAAKKIHDKIEENKARIVESRKTIAQTELEMPVSPTIMRKHKRVHDEVKQVLEEEQAKYRANLGILRDLKNECDHLTHSIKQAEVRFIHNFQDWLLNQGNSSFLSDECNQEIPQKLVESTPEVLLRTHLRDEKNDLMNEAQSKSLIAKSLMPPQSKDTVMSNMLAEISQEFDPGYDSAMTSTASSSSNIGAVLNTDVETVKSCRDKRKDGEYFSLMSPSLSKSIGGDDPSFYMASFLQNEIGKDDFPLSNGMKHQFEERNVNYSSDIHINKTTSRSLLQNLSPSEEISDDRFSFGQEVLSPHHPNSELFHSDNAEFSSTFIPLTKERALSEVNQKEFSSNRPNRCMTKSNYEKISFKDVGDSILKPTDIYNDPTNDGLGDGTILSCLNNNPCTSITSILEGLSFDTTKESITLQNESSVEHHIPYTPTDRQRPIHQTHSMDTIGSREDPLLSSEMINILKDLCEKHTNASAIPHTEVSGNSKEEEATRSKSRALSDSDMFSFHAEDSMQDILSNLLKIPKDVEGSVENCVQDVQRSVTGFSSPLRCMSPTIHTDTSNSQNTDDTSILELLNLPKTKHVQHKTQSQTTDSHAGNAESVPTTSRTHSPQSIRCFSPSLLSPEQTDASMKGTKRLFIHQQRSQTSLSQTNETMDNGDNTINSKQGISTDPVANESSENEEAKQSARSTKDNKSSDMLFSNIPLTGDPDVDEEILAFYRAKQQALLGQNIMKL